MSGEEHSSRDYYGGPAGRGSAVRASGWRRRIGQYARFELALSPWEGAEIESVLDLGCGTGELAAYLEETERDATYVGVDSRSAAVRRARERHPNRSFVHGDLFDHLSGESFDLVIAVGAQVDGRERREREARVRRIERIVRRCATAARRGMTCVVLDQNAIRERAMLRAEPALFGVEQGELARLADASEGDGRVFSDVLRTDLGLAVGYRGETPQTIESERVLERAGAVHARQGGSRVDRVWLWLEAGRYENAREVLEQIDRTGPRLRHLEDRIRREM